MSVRARFEVPRDPRTVGRLIGRSASRLPGKVAITFDDRSWTYAELDRAVGRVAAQLRARGLEPGRRLRERFGGVATAVGRTG